MSPIFRVNHMELVAMSLLCSWVTINGYYLARRSTRVYFQQRRSREFLLLLYITNLQLYICVMRINASWRPNSVTYVSVMLTTVRSYCYQHWNFVLVENYIHKIMGVY